MGRWGIGSVVALALTAPALAADRPPFAIEPGPTTMSAEEAALVPDAGGAQHAIVLADDTLRDDTLPQLGRHYRVKILSREWRGIGDIALPREARSLLKRFWAVIIPPQGPPTELGIDDMVRQTVVQRHGYKEEVFKLALPKVEPGSVLDLGYVLADRGDRWTRIMLQEPHEVRLLRYWWAPVLSIPSQYHVRRRPGVNVTVTRGKTSIFLQATDLPTFVDEPWSPPDDLIRAVAILHYTFDEPNADPNVFWNAVAKDEEDEIREFLKDDAPLREALASLSLPAGAPLAEKLTAIYAWIGTLRNTDRLTAEEDQERASAREEELHNERRSAFTSRRQVGSLADVLTRKEGSGRRLDQLFIGMARLAGAHASLVLASSRVDETWERTLLNRYQFSDSFVAIQAPGEPLEKAVFADPGSGLPYGVVDWRYTATKVLVATPEGAREAVVPHQAASANLLQTRARIGLEAGTGLTRVTWSSRGSGQRGVDERENLRSSSPEDRERSIRLLCGEGPGLEVARAAFAGLDAGAPPGVDCEGVLVEEPPAPGVGRFHRRFTGPWVPAVPALVMPSRVHPVVWRYPEKDVALIDVEAPEGFLPGQPPSPVRLQSPYGEYTLAVAPAPEGGFHVERTLVMKTLTIKPEQYGLLRAFLNQVRRADEIPLTFVRPGDTR